MATLISLLCSQGIFRPPMFGGALSAMILLLLLLGSFVLIEDRNLRHICDDSTVFDSTNSPRLVGLCGSTPDSTEYHTKTLCREACACTPRFSMQEGQVVCTDNAKNLRQGSRATGDFIREKGQSVYDRRCVKALIPMSAPCQMSWKDCLQCHATRSALRPNTCRALPRYWHGS